MRSTEKIDIIHTKMLFPPLTDQKELSGDDVKQFIQVALGDTALVIGNDALACAG